MLDLITQLYQDMRAHKQRTFLAVFGILWGTVSVVVLIALGQGFYTVGKKSIEKLSAGVVFAIPRSTTLPYQGLPQGRILHIKANDVMNMRNVIHLALITPKLHSSAQLSYQGLAHTQKVMGVSSDFGRMNGISLQQARGRFINESDETLKRHVVVIGGSLAAMLFKTNDPLHKTLMLKGIPFLVIGVLETNHTGFNFSEGNNPWDVFIPYSTFTTLFGNVDVSYFSAAPIQATESGALKKSILQYFAKRYYFNPEDVGAIDMPNVQQFADFFSLFFRAVQLFLGFCGAMTLGVGGVNVANMMFLIVSERTREIGLRMALGATEYHILSQILTEAFMIVLIGGFLGAGLSWGIIMVLQHIALPAWLGVPNLSVTSMIITFIVLTIVALLAGFFPARMASKLDPVIALSSL